MATRVANMRWAIKRNQIEMSTSINAHRADSVSIEMNSEIANRAQGTISKKAPDIIVTKYVDKPENTLV